MSQDSSSVQQLTDRFSEWLIIHLLNCWFWTKPKVDTGDFCLPTVIWFAFKDLPPSHLQSTLFRLDAPHCWDPRIHTWPSQTPHSLATAVGAGIQIIPLRLAPRNCKGDVCWELLGQPCRQSLPERKDAQSQAILRERKRGRAETEKCHKEKFLNKTSLMPELHLSHYTSLFLLTSPQVTMIGTSVCLFSSQT